MNIPVIVASGKMHPVLFPGTGETVGKVFLSTVNDVDLAVQNAHRAFQHDTLTPYKRYEILFKVYEQLLDRKETFARLITSESGKIIRESRVELDRAASTLLMAAEEAKRLHGDVLSCDVTPLPTGKTAHIHRCPLGVIAAITPFNFPVNTAAHKIAPAIASGNAVVLKPSLLTPLSAEAFIQLFVDAGLPKGLLHIVHGDAQIGEVLVSHPLVRMVTLTGSVQTGQRVSHIAGMKKLSLELGGNDPLIVWKDADISAAAATAVEQGFGSCGQRCTAIKRLFVHKDVQQTFTSELLSRVQALKIGNPYDTKTDIGPMISKDAAREIENRVSGAVKAGAVILLSCGERDGAMHPPVVLKSVPANNQLVNEETFGPVLPLQIIDTADEVIKLSNSTAYGLQAGVFTNDLALIKRLFRGLDVGTLIVNGGPGFRVDSLPFGGVKNSGLGREGILAATRDMTEEKTLIF